MVSVILTIAILHILFHASEVSKTLSRVYKLKLCNTFNLEKVLQLLSDLSVWGLYWNVLIHKVTKWSITCNQKLLPGHYSSEKVFSAVAN